MKRKTKTRTEEFRAFKGVAEMATPFLLSATRCLFAYIYNNSRIIGFRLRGSLFTQLRLMSKTAQIRAD
jgi:hypothetical protein